MQKVSKQSLAMIALSILLAISIALTFTFAALSQSKTATGTISFNGGAGLQFNNLGSLAEANNEIKFTLTFNGETTFTTNLSNAEVKLVATSLNSNVKVSISYNETNKVNLAKVVQLKQITGFSAVVENAMTTSAQWTANSGSVKVADVLEYTVPNAATMAALVAAEANTLTFSLKFEIVK